MSTSAQPTSGRRVSATAPQPSFMAMVLYARLESWKRIESIRQMMSHSAGARRPGVRRVWKEDGWLRVSPAGLLATAGR